MINASRPDGPVCEEASAVSNTPVLSHQDTSPLISRGFQTSRPFQVSGFYRRFRPEKASARLRKISNGASLLSTHGRRLVGSSQRRLETHGGRRARECRCGAGGRSGMPPCQPSGARASTSPGLRARLAARLSSGTPSGNGGETAACALAGRATATAAAARATSSRGWRDRAHTGRRRQYSAAGRMLCAAIERRA